MTTVLPEVLVLGAGVSGLTTAVCLAESGFAVLVRARELPHRTTSCSAGAIWSPYLVSHPNVDTWGLQTLDELIKLSADRQTGVRMVTGTEAARSPVEPPAWATAVADFRRCVTGELPDGFVSGWRYTVPVIDMPSYLSYLAQRLTDAGGRIELGRVVALDDERITVNCTGFGARDLVPDDQLQPVRGQLVVAANPGVEEFFAEHAAADEHTDENRRLADPAQVLAHEGSVSTYYLPHAGYIVLGGSEEPGRVDLRPDLDTSAAIVSRCAAIEPRLLGVQVTDHRVGIRPSRPTVRVEHVRRRDRHIIHNYGHGGAGVSLSWGCAREVTELVARL
jgi:D-amino-acid oxidase